MKVLLAFYKTQHSKYLSDKIINWWTGNNGYCHVEIFIPDTTKRYTSSGRIGGVIERDIKSLKSYKNKLEDSTWKFVEIDVPCLTIEEIEIFYDKTKHHKYDWFGILGFVLPFKDREDRWFCSEWVATVLKNHNYLPLATKEPSKISPNDLYKIITEI